MRLIDAEPIIEMLKRVRKDADSPRRDLDLLNLQQLLEFAPEIAPPLNNPLTLEELREMDGEPVWCCNPKDIQEGHYTLVRYDVQDVPEYNSCAYAVGICWSFSDYGKTWLAYRRKPEEGAT